MLPQSRNRRTRHAAIARGRHPYGRPCRRRPHNGSPNTAAPRTSASDVPPDSPSQRGRGLQQSRAATVQIDNLSAGISLVLLPEYRRAKISSRCVLSVTPHDARGTMRPAATPRDGVRSRTAVASIQPRHRGDHGPDLLSPEYLVARSRSGQTPACRLWSLILDQYLPSPRPSGGSLVIIGPGTGCQGQWLFWDRSTSSQRRMRRSRFLSPVIPKVLASLCRPAVPPCLTRLAAGHAGARASGITSDQSLHPSPGSQRRWDGDDRRYRRRAR
jgi:hypothetical protein